MSTYHQDYLPYTPTWGSSIEFANMRNVLAVKGAEGGGSLLVYGYARDARGEPLPLGEFAKEPPSYFLGRDVREAGHR